MLEHVGNIVQDVRVAVGTAVGTASAGTGTMFDIIPSDIGKLASLVGIVLSCVLIYTHIQKYRHDMRQKKGDE